MKKIYIVIGSEYLESDKKNKRQHIYNCFTTKEKATAFIDNEIHNMQHIGAYTNGYYVKHKDQIIEYHINTSHLL